MSDVSLFSLLSLRNKRRMEEPGLDAGEEGRKKKPGTNNRKQQTGGKTNQEQTTESSKQTEKQTRNKQQKAANRRKNKPGTKHGVVRKRTDKETVYKEDK